MESLNSPKIFISYSWKPILNKERVRVLAERLQSDGVHVIIDIWDLKEGQDKYAFMEQMVTSSDIDKVLIICNKDYAEKSDKRDGGVGVESTIMSSEIYQKADQTKFIPIIFERDAKGNEYVPVFVKSRIYIDLSNDVGFEDNYETLLRNLYNKPMQARPALGTMPSYLQEDKVKFLPTAHKVTAIMNAYISEKKHVNILIDDYLDLIIHTYKESIVLEPEVSPVDDIVLEKFESLRPLRDDFVEFVEVVAKYGIDFDFTKFYNFWAAIIYMKDELTSSKQIYQFEHIFISIHELFIYFVSIILRKEKFSDLEGLLTDPVVFNLNGYAKIQGYISLWHNSRVLAIRNQRLNLQRANPMFDLFLQRANIPNISFDVLKQTDILLYYISYLNEGVKDANKTHFNYWFPITSLRDTYGALPLMTNAIKKSFFNKIKVLFRVETPEELREKCIELDKQINNWGFPYRVPSFIEGLNVNSLATVK